jgi:hypothetical protein
MIKTNKKTCINLSTDSYTGKEQSPKGFGYSADGFELNYEKTGQDNRIWAVQIKNNRKVWVRRNTNISNITHEEPIINDNTNDTNDSNDSNDDNNDINNDSVAELKEDLKEDLGQVQVEEKIKKNKNDKNDKNDKECKKTDYNIFLKYYLELIKIMNESLPKNERKSNKELFIETVNEWKNIKKLILDKKNNKDLIDDYIKKWNDVKSIPLELIDILQK